MTNCLEDHIIQVYGCIYQLEYEIMKNDFVFFITGLLFDQDVQLNKRSDSGERLFRMDIKSVEGNVNVGKDRLSESENIMSEDKITRIKGCATMWHENSDEICEMLKSIFRMDEDYCAR